MRLSIVSPAPNYPGSSGVLAGTYLGIYRMLCPHRPGTYGLMREDISFQRARKYPGIYSGMSAYAGTLTKGARGYGAGTYPGIYKKMCPTVLGLYLGHHKVQN